MLHDEVDRMLEHANELLGSAEQEMERSHEDVVTHMVCMNSRQSIANYLAGFLIQRKAEVPKPVTLQSLLDKCKEMDARFDSIDLSPIHCRCETGDSDYCLEHSHVAECMRIAQQARSIVMYQTPGY